MSTKNTTYCCVRSVFIFPEGYSSEGIPGYLSVICDTEDCITWNPHTENTTTGL